MDLLLLLVLAFPLPGLWNADPAPVYDAWVAFTDKGIQTREARLEALAELERSFDPRALERRRKRRTLPGLFDEHDLPLDPEYLAGARATGAEVRVKSRWLNGVTVLATEAQLEALRALPYVLEVTDLHLHVPKGRRGGRVPSDPDLIDAPADASAGPYGWAREQVEQLRLHSLHSAGFRGAGIRIAVIDTGFLDNHPAFSGPDGHMNVVAQWDFMDNDSITAPEQGDRVDQHEHGTMVLGTIAARRSGALVGSAPDADYILLKAEDGESEYFLEERWFAAALEFAEANGADVISSSLVLYEGYDRSQVDGRTSVMAQAWNLAVANGVFGFQGGGNSGHDEDPATHHLLPPAGAPGVVAVGAVDVDGETAQFSSDGFAIEGTVKPEVLALGQQVATVSPYVEGAYTRGGGTSMAAPIMAGGFACLLQAHPGWTNQRLRSALFESGDHFIEHGRPDPLFIQGYGIPDLWKASGLAEGRAGGR